MRSIVRLVEVTKVEWHQRAQFFAMAAQMMRRILVDAARARSSHKRGGMAVKVNLDETAILSTAPDRSILALDEALTAFSQAGAAPGQSGRAALFRRIDRGGNRRGSEDLAKHGPARLESRQGLAAAGIEPSDKGTIERVAMTPDRFQQIEELYHAAHEATAEERAALLAQTDPELRREVERLLSQSDRRRIP